MVVVEERNNFSQSLYSISDTVMLLIDVQVIGDHGLVLWLGWWYCL